MGTRQKKLQKNGPPDGLSAPPPGQPPGREGSEPPLRRPPPLKIWGAPAKPAETAGAPEQPPKAERGGPKRPGPEPDPGGESGPPRRPPSSKCQSNRRLDKPRVSRLKPLPTCTIVPFPKVSAGEKEFLLCHAPLDHQIDFFREARGALFFPNEEKALSPPFTQKFGTGQPKSSLNPALRQRPKNPESTRTLQRSNPAESRAFPPESMRAFYSFAPDGPIPGNIRALKVLPPCQHNPLLIFYARCFFSVARQFKPPY
ncbi:proline-rich receptor-like protein kinase PERK10 [Penaeus monodon]|uniref:proline-rich receptor-like protein kinase PERK10 n=1 Tax=Penaeus monodon TaxID=6687 RepID=UPI0018A72005|nr:proline-rich receptor-like protein kinase PERK10 [Penaeus monodon]